MSIKNNLPKRNKDPRTLIQARIKLALYQELKERLKKEGVFMQDFMETAIRMYLKE